MRDRFKPESKTMGHKTTTLLGTAAALAAGSALASPAVAAEGPVPVAATYADLLTPIPNAVERLKLADAQTDAHPARFIEAQYHHHHHHHHHNRGWYRRNGYFWSGGAWMLRPRHHHHHHHSHY